MRAAITVCVRAACLVYAIAAGLCAVLMWAPVAHAHAALVASDPVDGAMLSAAPARVALTFNEPVSPLVLRLLSPDGVAREVERVASRGTTLHAELPAHTLQGTYALSWRVVSADGHPVGGTVLYSLGQAGASAQSASVDNSLRRPLIWLARLALYVGLFFAVGGAVFEAFMSQDRRVAKALPQRAVWLGMAAVPLSLLLHGLDALDAPWRSALDGGVWRAALGTTYAFTLALSLVALIAALVALRSIHARRRRGAAATAALLLGIALAASGHASVAPPQWLARPAVLLHGIAVAAWLGALLPLAALMRVGGADSVAALRSFSRRIPAVVLVLVASGVALAFLQVDALAALSRTAYGQVLLLKLLLVASLFMLAGWNRYRLTDRVLSGQSGARVVLRRAIAIEVIVVLCVLATVALWRFTPPPRALTETESSHAVAATQLRADMVACRIVLTPAGLRLMLTDTRGAPLSPGAVAVALSNAAQGIEALEREARPIDPGVWEVAPLSLPAAPRWDVRVDVLVSDFERVRLYGELVLRDRGASAFNP